jgi:hypothetical protein
MRIEISKSWVAAAIMLLVGSTIQAADSDFVREMKDRAEIDALMWSYCRALDSMDENGYAAVYTPDGRFASGANVSVGTDALKKIILDVKKRRAEQEAKGEKPQKMYHVITNSTLKFIDKDRARIDAYWMTVFGSSSRETPPRVAAVGRSIDELVRVNGKWLIKVRDVQPVD